MWAIRYGQKDVLEADLTVIYYTANVIPPSFAYELEEKLIDATSLPLGDYAPIIKISQSPDVPRSQVQIYRNVLEGAQKATTKYVAMAEDDCLYSPEHFKHRPKDGHWAYNMNAWSIFTWGEPMFTYKAPGGRKNLNGLICERQMLIEHLNERFQVWPDASKIDIRQFGEPGKYDNAMGTTPHPIEEFYTNPPNIVFSHEANLQFEGLGKRKAMGQIRATEIPYWGKAKDIQDLYGE